MRASHAVLALATLLSLAACGSGNPVAPTGRATRDGSTGLMGSGNAVVGTDTTTTTTARGGLGLMGSGN